MSWRLGPFKSNDCDPWNGTRDKTCFYRWEKDPAWRKHRQNVGTIHIEALGKVVFFIPEERDVQWFLNATQAMIKKIDKEAAERRIQHWLSKMKRVLNRRSSTKEVSKDWKALSNFIKKGRAPPITAVVVADQENQVEGVESVQKTYAVETNEILQQIEKKWEPVFNRPKEANCEEFLGRFRNYVEIQQCTIPELTGKDLKNKAKEISLTRSVAMCGWRTVEIKALPEKDRGKSDLARNSSSGCHDVHSEG